jgi:hypothetical protein
MRSLAIAALLAACGDDGGGGITVPGDSGSDGAACSRQPAAADRTRYIVVSHPYGSAQTQSNAWEVLDLSPAGVISRPGRTFQMGRATVGEIAFTADGKIGFAPQDDGSVGVFKLDDAGIPTVPHAKLTGDFYAHKVVVGPDGAMYVLDNQWRENGGGIYRLEIGCDDSVRDAGLVVASKLPAGLAFLPSSRALLAATDIGSSPAGAEGHVLDWSGTEPSVSASTDLFADNEAIIGGTAVTHDGGYFLAGDISAFGSVPNRVAIAQVTSSGFGTVEMIPDVEDPLALIADPDAIQVFVASGFGDAMFVLDKPTTTWRKREVTYIGGKPQLPGGAVMVSAGMLRGHLFVAENLGVRHARFVANGVEDLGLFSLGMGIENSTGAIGVTP